MHTFIMEIRNKLSSDIIDFLMLGIPEDKEENKEAILRAYSTECGKNLAKDYNLIEGLTDEELEDSVIYYIYEVKPKYDYYKMQEIYNNPRTNKGNLISRYTNKVPIYVKEW